MWELSEEKPFADPRLRYYFKRQDLNLKGEDLFTIDCASPDQLPAWYDFTYTNAYGQETSWPYCGGSNRTTVDASYAKGYWGRDHGNNDGTPPDGQKRTHRGIYPAAGAYDDGNAATERDRTEKNQLATGPRGALYSDSFPFVRKYWSFNTLFSYEIYNSMHKNH